MPRKRLSIVGFQKTFLAGRWMKILIFFCCWMDEPSSDPTVKYGYERRLVGWNDGDDSPRHFLKSDADGILRSSETRVFLNPTEHCQKGHSIPSPFVFGVPTGVCSGEYLVCATVNSTLEMAYVVIVRSPSTAFRRDTAVGPKGH